MKKRYMYILFLFLIILGGFVIKPTLAKFASSYTTNSDVVGLTFNFDLKISGIEEYNQITITPGEYEVFNVQITNSSGSDLYYGVWYKYSYPDEVSDDVFIGRLEDTETTTSGDISSGGVKTVTVIAINNSDDYLTVDFGVLSNSTSASDIEYLDGRKLVSGTLREPKYANDYVIDLYNDGSSINTVNIANDTSNPEVSLNSTQGIMLDNNDIYRYYGADPNNYVSYNDELWRIIGVENVKSSSSNTTGEMRVKLIKSDILTAMDTDTSTDITTFSWDSSDSSVNSGNGVNDWSQSDLMDELNSLYYKSTSGLCYTGSSDTVTSCDFTDSGLGREPKFLINNSLFYLGGSSVYDGLYADDYYTFERGDAVYDCSTDDGACPRATTWLGKVGVMYPSDYGYAADLSLCTSSLSGYNASNCTANNWLLDTSIMQWTISPYSNSASSVFRVNSTGVVYGNSASNVMGVRPVVYLRPEVKIVDGSGTSDDPYQLYMWGISDTADALDVTYTITYDANGGTDAPEAQIKTHGINMLLSGVVPKKEGYDFVGWGTSADDTTKDYSAGGVYKNDESITLYAIWELKTYDVTFNANGGSGAPDDQEKTHGTNLTLSSTVPTRDGYDFVGWGTSASDTTKDYDAGGTYSTDEDITLYAIWQLKTYTVSFNANNGSGAPADQTKTHGTNLTLSSTVPTRTGYDFVGWGTSASDTTKDYDPGGTYSTDSAITLYAIWQLKTYTVSFEANNGSGAPADQTKTHGTNLTLSSTVPTRDGYDFIGWGTSASDTTKDYDPGGTYSTEADITLYAIWSAKTYTVSFNANGGSGAPAEQTKTHGTNLTLSSTVPTYSGHSFVGWGTSASDTTKDYDPGGTYSTDAAITLYAIWEVSAFVLSETFDDTDTDSRLSFSTPVTTVSSSYGTTTSYDMQFSVSDGRFRTNLAGGSLMTTGNADITGSITFTPTSDATLSLSYGLIDSSSYSYYNSGSFSITLTGSDSSSVSLFSQSTAAAVSETTATAELTANVTYTINVSVSMLKYVINSKYVFIDNLSIS